MPPDLSRDMAILGNLARTSSLRRLGHSPTQLQAAVADGALVRPVRGWVATPLAERDAVIAALHGGALTSASALGSRRVWRGLDRSIHVLVPPNSPGRVSRAAVPLTEFAAPRPLTAGVVRHWGWQHWPVRALDWRVSVVDALAAFARDTDVEHFVAALDSALYTREIHPFEVARLFGVLPARLQGARSLVDGRAESGTESIARLRFGRVARTVEIQVTVGRHRIDILLDGWLAVEIDSEEWHSGNRVEDLRKSTWLTAQGYRVEHYDYQQVMNEWEWVERAVREALADPRPPVLR